MKCARWGVGVVVSVLLLVSQAFAEDDWKFEFVPYLWASGIDGDITVGERTASVDVGFDDLFDAVDIGGSFLAVTQYNKWVLWTQLDYFELDSNELDDAPARSRLESDSLFATAAVGYQFKAFGEHSTVDVLVGARYFGMDSKLTISSVGSREGDIGIWDAIFMLRPNFQLLDWLHFNPTLSIGGGDSNLTYELQPQFQFRLTDVLVARLGYRRLFYDVDGSRGNNFDGAFHGLIAGLGFTF